MNLSEIANYWKIAKRRRYWVAIPFMVTVLCGLIYLLEAPKVYEASTLILVQPQKVPEDYVRSIVSTNIDDRLRTISQQVTSRTNLEKIINEHDLYKDPSEKQLTLDEKVDLFRKAIKIDVARGGSGGSAFSISFRCKNPIKVMHVTNALASNFISENLKIRESQALGTSVFLADELNSIRKRLLQSENELKDYRHRNMGMLPDQLQSNLTLLQAHQMQLEQLNSNLRDAENRRLILQNQSLRTNTTGLLGGSGSAEAVDDLTSLKKQMVLLQSRYTSNHPDIRRLRSTIAKLEANEPATALANDLDDKDGAETFTPQQPKEPFVSPEVQEIDLQIAAFKSEIKSTQAKIERLQHKISETPRIEQELLSMNRDYDNIKDIYNSILNRKLEAEIAVSMEKKQKGEQFRVVDPAKVPELPVEPDVRKIILFTLILGLGLGAGSAYLREISDTSYKVPEDLETELKIPVLVSVPTIYTENAMRIRKRRSLLLATSLVAAFSFSFVGIIIASKGVASTLNYLKAVLAVAP